MQNSNLLISDSVNLTPVLFPPRGSDVGLPVRGDTLSPLSFVEHNSIIAYVQQKSRGKLKDFKRDSKNYPLFVSFLLLYQFNFRVYDKADTLSVLYCNFRFFSL